MSDRTKIMEKLESNSRVKSILEVDTKWIDYAILIGTLVMMVVLIVETRGLSRWEAQRTPLVIFSTIIVLVGLELARQIGIIDWGGEDNDSTMSSFKEEIDDKLDDDKESGPVPLLEQRVEFLRILGWIFILFASVYTLGLLVGCLVFLLLFYHFESGVDLVQTILISGAIFFLAWFVFEGLLGARLYEGILEIGEIFYHRISFI